MKTIGALRLWRPSAWAISSISSVPVRPYSMDMPYNSMPEASAPSTKYFIAASEQG